MGEDGDGGGSVGSGADIDWSALNAKLPYERTESSQNKRKKMFKDFDPNRNGYLSLAETDSGMRSHLGSDLHFDAKTAIKEAFHYAKNKSSSDSKFGEHFLEFREFRLFLQTLRQYFEYYEAFKRIDTGDDGKINREEFLSDDVAHALGKWTGGDLGDMEAEFDAIDINGGGEILFREFVKWALDKNLDIEDEDDLLAEDDDYKKDEGKRSKSAKTVSSERGGGGDSKEKDKGKSKSCAIL